MEQFLPSSSSSTRAVVFKGHGDKISFFRRRTSEPSTVQTGGTESNRLHQSGHQKGAAISARKAHHKAKKVEKLATLSGKRS